MESISPTNEDRHFMSHPEIATYMRDLFPCIIAESDRGAILLGTAQIDEQLNLLFAHLIPSATKQNYKNREISDSSKPFRDLGTKLRIAYVCRLLPVSLIDAIHKLKKLRNDVAHKPSSFNLKAHEKDVRGIFALVGSGCDIGVSWYSSSDYLMSFQFE